MSTAVEEVGGESGRDFGALTYLSVLRFSLDDVAIYHFFRMRRIIKLAIDVLFCTLPIFQWALTSQSSPLYV